jgi:hypothetical protein
MQFLGVTCFKCNEFMAEAAISNTPPLGAGVPVTADASILLKCPDCGHTDRYPRVNFAIREMTLPPKMSIHPTLHRISVNDAVEHVEAARPVHRSMLRGVMVPCFGGVALGALAIYRGASADTSFEVLGAHLKTSHVGVAVVGISALTLLFVYRRMMKSIETLAALPPDRGR